MSANFTYDDIVQIAAHAAPELRPGSKAWIVGVFDSRPAGTYFEKFPEGTVYSVEYEDGSSVEVHETDLVLWDLQHENA
jgi:hypothetical protein